MKIITKNEFIPEPNFMKPIRSILIKLTKVDLSSFDINMTKRFGNGDHRHALKFTHSSKSKTGRIASIYHLQYRHFRQFPLRLY